jgi:hypothetical protein
MKRAALLLAFTIAAGVVAAAFAAEGTPLRATRLREQRPVSDGTYLVWAQDSRRKPRVYGVYAQARRGKPFKVNRRGQGFAGAISGTTLVYQEFTRRDSSIRFYDLRRRRHLRAPVAVNTGRWEWRPSLSGDWLLFSRHDRRTERVLLRNLVTRAQIELDSGRMPARGNYGIAGQVNGNFAVWERCPPSGCTVFRYDLTTRLTTPYQAPPGRIHYAPSVALDGTVYLGRSEPRCGRAVEMWRYSPEGVPTRLFTLPTGWDFANTYVHTRKQKAPVNRVVNDVYYDRGRCRGFLLDAYRISDSPLPPIP